MPIIAVEHDKVPNSKIDYGFDWTQWLNGRTLTASTWSAPAGITIDANSFTSAWAIVRLSGGTAGQTYIVTNHITDSDTEEEERSMLIRMR